MSRPAPDPPQDRSAPDAVRSAQRLRMRRTLWGFAAYGAQALIATGCALAGLLDPAKVAHFVIASVVINATFLILIATGANLRFREPSLTGAQVIASLWPSIYVMYHVTTPEARLPFLLTAAVAMLFGALVYGRRQMLVLGGIVLGSYLLMLGALFANAPERLDPRVEGVVVFAYAIVLIQVAFLGSYIAGLRGSLRSRNRELREAMSQLEELATRDPLTRLPNRRAAMLQLQSEASRQERRGLDQSMVCIGLLDLDHFKRINDSFGHPVGDDVLRAVGNTIAENLRSGDFAARFGGEEFLLVFSDATPEGAGHAAERIRASIAALQVDGLPDGTPIDVSVGLACHRAGESVDSTLSRADRALYAAKAAGRARVVSDEQAPVACDEQAPVACDEQAPVACDDQAPVACDDQAPVACDDQGLQGDET